MEILLMIAAFLLGIIVENRRHAKTQDQRRQWKPLNQQGERLRLFR